MAASNLEEAHQLVERAIASTTERRDDIAILVVSNLKEQPHYSSRFDRSAEYFNESELDEITNALRSNGIYVDVYIGEEDFIRWIEGGGLRHFHKTLVFVYNTAQSGIGAGRKSLIPAFCGLHNIGTLGSDAYVVSLARHKASWTFLPSGEWLNDRSPPEGERVLAKSCFESSSIGIGPGSAFPYHNQAKSLLLEIAKGLDQPVVVQSFISGSEYSVPVLTASRSFALGPVGISLDGSGLLGERFLDFETVANNAYDFYEPANESLVKILRAHSEDVIHLLGVQGFGRVDFRVSEDGMPYVTDVSTSPHLTAHGAFAYRFRQHTYDAAAMFATLVGLRLVRAST
jgi:D-alanine-D-alanine ligase